MKTLYLLRHAKSAWDDPTLDDHDRPLAPRGERAAVLMGRYLAQCQIAPELVLCSTARRAMDTRALAFSQLGGEPTTEFERALYLAGRKGVLARLAAVAGGYASILVIGHNPDLHDLARGLADTGDPSGLSALAAKLPTAGFVALELDIDDWADIAKAHGRLVDFKAPRDLV
ncbi:MAG: histidine phosphatase family protein [Azospirillaceae bacterium]